MRKTLIALVGAIVICGAFVSVSPTFAQGQQCGGSFVPSVNCIISGFWNFTRKDPVSALPTPFQVSGVDATGLVSACSNLTNAQVLALNTTAVTIVGAPGPSKAIDVIGVDLAFKYTAAYTSVQNLKLYYGDRTAGNAASASITGSGLLDATANTIVRVTGTPDNTNPPITNLGVAIEQVNNSAIGGGNASNSLRVCVNYRVVTTGF